MIETYTLYELTDRAGRALDALGVQVGNRRVRQRPDARTIRYYSQVGLVDRPLPTAGRAARYGQRHLVQVVAVKRLQEAGVTLAEVQRRLAGATDDELLAAIGPSAAEALAAVTPPVPVAPVPPAAPTPPSAPIPPTAPAAPAAPAAPTAPSAPSAPAPPAAPTPMHRAETFWRARPAMAAAGARTTASEATAVDGTEPSTAAPRDGVREVLVVRLAPGVELTFDAAVATNVDIETLRAAARPLVEQLRITRDEEDGE